MRIPLPAAVGGALVALVGGAGLIRAAVPESLSAGAPPSQPIIVTGAYVRAPVPPTDAAAAYFTVTNTTGKPDRLESVVSGAGASSVLHTTVHGRMVALPNGVVIPAHGKLVLTTGQGHVMIQQLFGKLAAGQNVNLSLSFENGGTIDINAPVIAVGAPAPTGAPPPSGQSSPSR